MFGNPFKRSDEKHRYASDIPPTFFELEVCYFPGNLRTRQLSIDVTATPDRDEQGYGSAQVLAAHTDNGYWYESMLTYNWGSKGLEDRDGRQYHFHLKGYSVQFHVWEPNGQPHWFNETHLLGGERVDIKDGERINLAMEIRGDEVTLGVYGRKPYEIKYPSYGAKYFTGDNIKKLDNGRVQMHERGYFTGVALERYHTHYTWGGKRDKQYKFQFVAPGEVKHGSFQVHERDDSTKQNLHQDRYGRKL